MSRSSSSQRAAYRLSVKLDYEQDAEIIQWLESQPTGHRSEAVRRVLRAHIDSGEESIEEVIRAIIADEVVKALDGVSVNTQPQDEQGSPDIEHRYGDRLDQMLGGLDQSDRK